MNKTSFKVDYTTLYPTPILSCNELLSSEGTWQKNRSWSSWSQISCWFYCL